MADIVNKKFLLMRLKTMAKMLDIPFSRMEAIAKNRKHYIHLDFYQGYQINLIDVTTGGISHFMGRSGRMSNLECKAYIDAITDYKYIYPQMSYLNDKFIESDKMMIKIKHNAAGIYADSMQFKNGQMSPQYNINYMQMLSKLADQLIEVETEYLFNDQFNTVPIEGISSNGLRIMEKYTDYVVNDKRINRRYCNCCHKNFEDNKVSITCPYCAESNCKHCDHNLTKPLKKY